MLQYVYARLILQLCGCSGPTAPTENPFSPQTLTHPRYTFSTFLAAQRKIKAAVEDCASRLLIQSLQAVIKMEYMASAMKESRRAFFEATAKIERGGIESRVTGTVEG